MRVSKAFLAAISWALACAGAGQAEPTPPLFGDDAWLIESGGSGTPANAESAMDCVISGEKPPCKLHPIVWMVAPDAMAGFANILKVGKRDGVDFLICAVNSGGSLTACETTSTEAQAVTSDLLHSFKAPQRTSDHKPVGVGPILIQINWKALYPAAQKAQPEPAPAASPDARVFCHTPLQYYPIKAQRANMPGVAHISCLVDRGKLTDCRVVDENPVGYDFGDAAICMAPLEHMRPGSAPGARFTLPFNFELPN